MERVRKSTTVIIYTVLRVSLGNFIIPSGFTNLNMEDVAKVRQLGMS